jgi:hypothetical protein
MTCDAGPAAGAKSLIEFLAGPPEEIEKIAVAAGEQKYRAVQALNWTFLNGLALKRGKRIYFSTRVLLHRRRSVF